MSEITYLGDSRFAIIERDNQPGVYSTYKVITTIDLSTVTPVAAGEELEIVEKTQAVDIRLPAAAKLQTRPLALCP